MAQIADSNILSVWLISDGVPGHFNQSQGVIRALANQWQVEAQVIEVRLRYKPLRWLMRLLCNHAPDSWLPAFWKIFYATKNMPDGAPNLIVSAGGNTLCANISMAKKFKSPNLFSGTMKGYDHRRIELILSVVPLLDSLHNLVLDLPPANLVFTEFPQADDPLITLLIGGDGAKYFYTQVDWQNLADGINALHQKFGYRWLITTSRRTGKMAEEILRKAINPAAIEDAVWYAAQPRKVVQHFLQRSSLVFCSEDSLTMVSEAIYSARKVYSLQPDKMNPVENDRLALEKYQDAGLISRIALAQLGDLELTKAVPVTLPDVDRVICDAVAMLELGLAT